MAQSPFFSASCLVSTAAHAANGTVPLNQNLIQSRGALSPCRLLRPHPECARFLAAAAHSDHPIVEKLATLVTRSDLDSERFMCSPARRCLRRFVSPAVAAKENPSR
ncbi:hypothetical protein E2553_13005 [Paraburkholderia dipogonis]|uniref:Secreted protein n=1 Tax=Paraburkholderia dipogonis TaxID=1211383 RepID=A0A4Y8N7X5_9BURK|nr:hypothetical protein E2553_13005 [Paraburkholderia dipogonis]